jgi:hypothetical protein
MVRASLSKSKHTSDKQKNQFHAGRMRETLHFTRIFRYPL